MLKETGAVVAIEEDGLWVETVQQSACASCAAKTGCGTQVLAKFTAAKNMTFVKAFFDQQSKNLAWQVGDRAILGIEENALVKAAIIAYGLPLVFMLVTAGLVSQWVQLDFVVALSAFVGLVGGAILVRLFLRFSRGNTNFHAIVLGKTIVQTDLEVGSVESHID